MINSLLNNELRNVDWSLLILRLIGGGFMLTHGYPKFMKVLDGDFGFADPFGFGPAFSLILVVFAEFVCAIALIIGFKVRLASIPLLFTMIVAAFMIHGGDPWQKKELALIYGGVYLVLLFMGGGRFGIDGRNQ
jgi:putative oxidoreductase